MGRTCPHCNSSAIEEDPARGDATCMDCGTVLEESNIVSDVQFQEKGGGGFEMVGQFVSRDRAQPNTLMGVPGMSQNESREATYNKGRNLINQIGSQLRINQRCRDIALNFFKMCVSRNLTRGRLRSQVVVACLYMQCRLDNTPHLLLDFSDVTQINIFDLGKTLNFLTRSLHINLPATDPCLYILRFAVLLDLGDKQKEVVSLATRIVDRMKRDWISTGRRPTGLCGAALLLAARAHNVNRNVADIVRVVHISESVVRKRLDEFATTPSGALTIDEFATVDLEESEDPPAFQDSKKKAREAKGRTEEDAKLDKATTEMEPLKDKIEEALKKKLKTSPYTRAITDGLVDQDVPELSTAAGIVGDDIIDTVYEAAESDYVEPSTSGQDAEFGPSLTSLGISRLQQPLQQEDDDEIQMLEVGNADGDLDLEDIDDEEIESYILTKSESTLKAELWMKRNGEHLAEKERQRKLKEEELEKMKDRPKRKRKARSKKEPITASTHGDAIRTVIQERNLTRKINWSVLDDDAVKGELVDLPALAKKEEAADAEQ